MDTNTQQLQALDRIYSRLGITETPQIDAAIRAIDTLNRESSEYQDCSEFAAQVFDAFGVTYTSDKSKVFEAIDTLKQSQLDQQNVDVVCNQICAQLGVEWDQTKPLLQQTKTAIDNLKRSTSLKDAIAVWAEGCGENWQLIRLSIAENLVKQLLTAIAETPDLSPQAKAVLERDMTPAAALQYAIDNWFFEHDLDISESFGETITQMVVKLLSQIAQAPDDLTDTGIPILAQPGECYSVSEAGEFSKIEQLGAYSNGVYHLTKASGKPEVQYVCDSQEWQRLSEQINRDYNALSARTHQSTAFGKIQEVLRRRNSSERDAVSNFKAFQDDVLTWMRALSMVTSTIEGCTHREKDARLRGMIELIETAIQKIRDVQNQFADYHWQRPDIFRSDYPVQRYRQRIRELEAENAKLKGESTPSDDIVF